MIGLPLRLLAREVYDRMTARIGEQQVALITGEEKRIPSRPRYWICTVESMPVDREVDFVCIDEIQLATHPQRGHTFTDRLLHLRGREETWFLGSDAMAPMLEALVPTAFVRRHPRYSKLSYGGVQSIGSLPPRTAVVAFSVAEVYELAEQLRQRHGGTAVVLGALSPRARNAQVAMYEGGDVEYMVATDAIGMGLNLDLDRVVFASTSKFDGRQSRPLWPSELAQIAGRAGRYTRDGTFGLLRPASPLDPKVVHAIEHHHFAPARRVVWRNADLDFTSLEALEASLRVRPNRGQLRMLERADDFDALTQLARLSSVRARARGENAVQLLWDVCRIPDFRKLMLESHVELLARIYDQLSGPRGELDEGWMAQRIERLDDITGDIDTLMTRMAFIRTWTYVANHEHWVPNAQRWQARTRAIEDRHSDALHERLTERFVTRTVGTPSRPAGRKRAAPRSSRTHGAAPDPSSPFAALAQLHVSETHDVSEVDHVHTIVESDHDAFSVDARGVLRWKDEVLGRWKAGSDLLHPRVQVTSSDVSRGAERRIMRRLQAWTVDTVSALLEPLEPLATHDKGAVRGIAYQLQQGLGTVLAVDARAQLSKLRPEHRDALHATGVVLGRLSVHLPTTLTPPARSLRHALLFAYAPWRGPDDDVVWEPERSTWPRGDALNDEQLAVLGFVALGSLAVQADLAEEVAEAVAEQAERGDPFVAPEFVSTALGLRRRQLTGVLRGLGYWRVRGRHYSRTRPQRHRRRS